MAKLIPGKVRSQGSLLYEDGKVSLQEVKEKYLYFRVEEESLRYSLDDDCRFFVVVSFFQKEKNSVPIWQLWKLIWRMMTVGKLLLQVLKKMPPVTEQTQEKVSFGSLFLDQVLPKVETKEIKYGLSATGHVDDYSGQFLWTLRIHRFLMSALMWWEIILAFLQAVQKES